MIRLLKLIFPLAGRLGFIGLMALGMLSGLSNFLFISSATRVIGLTSKGEYTSISPKYLLIFAFIILLIILVRRILSGAIIKLSQTIFWELRKDILAIVLKADYQQLAGREIQIQASLLGDVYILTEAAMSVIGFATSLILAISCLVYLASLSLNLFLITLAVAILGTTIYYINSIKYTAKLTMARKNENRFVEQLLVILNGFKEIFMEPRKGRYIYERKIAPIATETYKYTTIAQIGFLNNQITGQVLFYALVTSILLIFSVTTNISLGTTVSFVFALFYLLGAIETIMILLPNLMRARVAANHLMDIKIMLETAGFNNSVPCRYISKESFERITVRGLEFFYGKEGQSFSIGPIDFDVEKGEVIFIYGDNGSGKTTFLHAILGLYAAYKGCIMLNDTVIEKDLYGEYRTAFAVVFSDFYLFNEVLDVEEVDMEKWDYYLHLFELDGKVRLEGKCFSTTELSTGQRKRLALISVLLEEKPVIVMDEWAADQDPYFRRKFYTEIIPVLKKEGFTIIAITHDDKYYHCADRLYKMSFGKLTYRNDFPASQANQTKLY